MKKIGFIGTGNMGGALILAAAKSDSSNELLLSDIITEKAEALAEKTGGKVCDNITAAKEADFLFLGVKPQMLADTMEEIAPVLKERKDRFVLVSMLAAFTCERINKAAGGSYPVIRIMPNTPVSIGEGMILYAANEKVTDEELEFFLKAFEKAGRFSPLAEKLIDAGASVAGCGPAFVDLFIEALADGGVACGLPRAKALEYAAQMTAGAAKLILESGKHPGRLKDEVCSPGGTTIQGVRALEKGGLRSAVTEAVIAAYEKNFEL
ncbi:MAG: pyrroline-5-carboxylate reductase [Oscillospiraceae bacterium]|nr:pyrroline-5-carboxylate reductase [Oscillospiraceae bacterium]MBQ3237304.1 pyrroline-5-carboxylate reductase [Oscillospiraceae bacterium]MBQ3561724.1 pyrroline-5-carboxylate reductase [Oscillospiraceae bacterium]MBQ6802658.1 pyrroline-5-carboxylate reductase [Oscillospiraceae bacterium]